MNKTRLALIGAGMIGKRHLKAMREVDETELVAIVDTKTFIQQFAQQWSVPFFSSS
jgi:predicted dehydrogenase